MQTNTHPSRPARERRIVHHIPGIRLGVLLGMAVACHPDAPLAPVTPSFPDLAVYSDGTWLVNSLADPGDGSCTNNECTLREAIAVAQRGDRITFKGNLSGTIALTVGELVLEESITIEARDPRQVNVDGRGLSTVFRIGGPGPDVLVMLSGLTISGGNSTSGSGGGIHVLVGNTLNLVGSVVTGNTAVPAGGGIANDPGGSLRVIASTVSLNSATFGGGIHSEGDLTVVRSTISSNTASLDGGGVNAFCSASFQCTGINVRSSTVTQNAAPEGGGVIITTDVSATLSNTIVAGNRASGSASHAEADCGQPSGFVSLGYNLSSAGTGCDLASPTDVLLQSPLQVFTSVIHPVLADNGGGRLTHALIERGRAIDAGYCPGENGDQRGFPRPYDDLRMPNALDACDIGAFEWNPPGTKGKGPKP